MNREIQALQQEQPRQDAKAELILDLLKEKREKKMSVLRKVSVPTLVSIAAIAGVFYVAQPRVVAATPDRVIKAIQDIKNYTISSFSLDGKTRHLQSKTTVNGKERHTVYYDNAGKEMAAPQNDAVVMMRTSPMGMGFKLDTDGNMIYMSSDDIKAMKKGEFSVDVKPDGFGGNGQTVRVEVRKDADGKEVKRFFINGKEVDHLPEVMGGGKVKILAAPGAEGHKDVRVQVTKDASGKEEKHIFVDGKEVDKLPDAVKMTGNFVKTKDGNTKTAIEGWNTNSKSVAVVSGKNGEKPIVMQSGQTSADYLVGLLKDTSRWTIERGVTYNGQKYDKFTVNGPISPIVLYVDPATALPKILQFGTALQQGATIEDVYQYGIQP